MKLKVQAERTGGEISSLWFGHNLEHTRSCIANGLSAQLIANRKFAGKPQLSGIAASWYAVGPPETIHILDASPLRGYGAFTRHYDPADHRNRSNEINRQRVISPASGRAGIGQKGITLQKGRSYQGRIALRSDPGTAVTLRILPHDGAEPIHFSEFAAGWDDWRLFDFAFDAPSACSDARIEITSDAPGEFHVGAVSLIPADHFHGMRRDVVDLLKEIEVPIMRWPGGNFAGDYRWQDGLLPVDQRAPLISCMPVETLPHTGGFDNHEIGIDEFIALCRELHAEPFLTINPAWESPQLSAAWLQYCNGGPGTEWGRLRVQRGHTEPYNVKFWSLGNEIGYGHMEGPNAPAAYAKAIPAYVTALRNVDPDITLVSSGYWDSDAWFSDGLSRFARHIDMIAHHRYTFLKNAYSSGEASEADWDAVARADVDNLDELRRIRGMADGNSGGRRVGISFDEWNVWYNWYAVARVVDGIYAASMLNMLCREGRGLDVRIGCYFQPVNEGAIRVEPDAARLTTIGRVMALFKVHHGNALVPLNGLEAGGDIDAAASKDAQGTLWLTLVNRHRQQDRQVEIDLPADSSVSESLLLSAETEFATAFTESELSVEAAGDTLTAALPKHSIARLRIALT